MTSKNKPVRLPVHIKPEHYDITIKPDLEAFKFEGEETIIISITKPIKEIILHAKELKVVSAELGIGNYELGVKKIKYDKKAETVTIIFPETIKKGKYYLKISFQGILNDQMRGFYRSRYEYKGKEKFMTTTQFEATDARRAFPCFDEPAQKATFKVKLIIPNHATAISNTIEDSIVEHESGYKIVQFAPTPKMSTYLLAFIVGEFEHLDGKTKNGTAVRIFTVPGKKHQAEFALDVAVRSLEFFEKYFGIPYPLPTMDLIAIPDFSSAAMENWGAVTYRESALLIDPDHSSLATKQWVAIVIAHELSHQWFGNLVTMEWWTHLWLNEGFASYMEHLAVDHLFPKWNIWDQFVSGRLAEAFTLDALANTHPIEVEVRHPDEISEIFDTVSYAKGASVIRMLAEYLGANSFREGLRHYLKKHSYGNTVTEDLWDSLEEISGKPVRKLMRNWTAKPGYPLISVTKLGKDLHIRQSRFFSSPHSEKLSNDKTAWLVPISAKSEKISVKYLLPGKEGSIKLPDVGNWIKLNAGEVSLFKTSYLPELLLRLKQPIERKTLPPVDRLGVIRDAFSLAEAGKMPTAEVLNLMLSYARENEYIVWVELLSGLNNLDQLLFGQPYSQYFQKFCAGFLKDAVNFAGFKPQKNESHSKTLLRNIILAHAARFGDKQVVDESFRLFRQWAGQGKAISPDLRGSVYTAVSCHGGKNDYNYLMDKYKQEDLHEEKNRLGRALGNFKDKILLQKTLEFSLSKHVRLQDSIYVFVPVFYNPYGRKLAWEYFKKNFKELQRRYGIGLHFLGRFIEPAENFNTEAELADATKFFQKHPAPGAERTIAQTLETIQSNILRLNRDAKKIGEWLGNNDQNQ